MLVIRQEQMRQFVASNENELEAVVRRSVVTANKGRLADHDEETLARMVRTAIETARAKNLSRPEDIAAFAALMFEISPRFYEQPEIKAVMEDPNFSVSERLWQLPERVSGAAWLEAETLYDPGDWFRDRS